MDSGIIDPPASEPNATGRSSNTEDIEAFVEDNINVETTSDAELGDSADHDPETLPTEEEWNSMRRYGSFITHDDVGKQYTFQVNDIIYVLPSDRSPEDPIADIDLWVAQIKSIRARNPRDVWIRAKWFYHPKELPNKLRHRYKHTFAKMERLSSNKADFISTSTCCGHASIIYFDEQNLDQVHISGSTLFYRYDYDWTKPKYGQIKKTSPPCSICKRAYNPNTDIIHFCPRTTCLQGWHDHCLERNNWYIKTLENFEQRIESMGGEFNIDMQVDQSSSRKRARLNRESRDGNPYERIPKELLDIARQPIIRGRSMGVVGNICSVTRARKLLRAAMRDGEQVPEDWKDSLGVIYSVADLKAVNTFQAKKVLAYACPKCGEPI